MRIMTRTKEMARIQLNMMKRTIVSGIRVIRRHMNVKKMRVMTTLYLEVMTMSISTLYLIVVKMFICLMNPRVVKIMMMARTKDVSALGYGEAGGGECGRKEEGAGNVRGGGECGSKEEDC